MKFKLLILWKNFPQTENNTCWFSLDQQNVNEFFAFPRIFVHGIPREVVTGKKDKEVFPSCNHLILQLLKHLNSLSLG